LGLLTMQSLQSLQPRISVAPMMDWIKF